MARKWTTGEVQRIDLHWLDRQGMLTPGRLSPVVWSSGGQRSGSIHLLACDDCVILHYRVRAPGSSLWQSVKQQVALTSVPTNFGGRRRLFLCPHCGRRCRDLFAGRDRFSCRICRRIAFRSQYQRAPDRASDQAFAIRKKLAGADASLLDAFPPKPSRMRWATYERLAARDEQLSARCGAGMAIVLERMARRARR